MSRVQCRDMPRDLTEAERIHYLRGWTRSALRYAKVHGLPNERMSDTLDLHDATADYMEEREPVTHKAGMAALAKFRKACLIAAATRAPGQVAA